MREALHAERGIIVVINRPGEYVVRKFYDKDHPPPAKGRRKRSVNQAPDVAEDVDVDAEEMAEHAQVPSAADELASSMKTLRLHGRGRQSALVNMSRVSSIIPMHMLGA